MMMMIIMCMTMRCSKIVCLVNLGLEAHFAADYYIHA